MKNSTYTESPRLSPQLTLVSAARAAGMSSQRFRRALQRLQVPITRVGAIILVNRSSIESVLSAIEEGLIRRGRPRKSEKEKEARS